MNSQPELGKMILSLRKEKGMTQLELREASHVSVRTIQRIESGSVTPRASTVKIMLRALGENPDDWFDASKDSSEFQFSINSVKEMLLINATEDENKNALSPSWIAGIVYLILVVLEIGMGIYLEEANPSTSFLTSYVGVKLMIVISYLLFMRGFLSLSILFENHLLKMATYISMALVAINYSVEAVVVISNQEFMEMADIMNVFFILPYGAISVIFGMGLLRLQDSMGRVAKVAGRLEIVYGISLVSLIFSFISVIVLAPVLIVEIVLLSKADSLARAGQL